MAPRLPFHVCPRAPSLYPCLQSTLHPSHLTPNHPNTSHPNANRCPSHPSPNQTNLIISFTSQREWGGDESGEEMRKEEGMGGSPGADLHPTNPSKPPTGPRAHPTTSSITPRGSRRFRTTLSPLCPAPRAAALQILRSQQEGKGMGYFSAQSSAPVLSRQVAQRSCSKKGNNSIWYLVWLGFWLV